METTSLGTFFGPWLVMLPGLAGIVLLVLICMRKSRMPSGMFAPLLVTSIVLILGSAGMLSMMPFVDVVSKVSSGEADDSGE